MRVIKNRVSLIKIMRAQCQNYILGVKWFSGCSKEGDHEVYLICYILRKNTHEKNFRQNKCYKIHFFLEQASTIITIFFLIFNSSMSWKQKIHQFSKSFCRVSIYYSIWVLLKSKRKKFFLIRIHSMQGWTATTRHGDTRKRLKHKKTKACRKSL